MARVKWENGARCAVCLTFDVDGETVWMGRDPSLGGRPIHNSMGAYGPKVGIPRILKLLKKYSPARRFLHPKLDGGEMAEDDRVHREGGA